MTRSRTYEWQDPMVIADKARQLSGLEFLQSMIDGKFPKPPMADTLNFTLAEVAYGHAVFVVEPAEYHYNPIGVVHGGLAMTIMDSALGCAVQSTLEAGYAYTTLQVNSHFVRAITGTTGTLRCTAKIIHAGRQMGTAEARLEDANGKLYAHATTTCLVFLLK